MFHYLTGKNDWSSEGIPNYLNEVHITDPDPFIIFSLNQQFPTEETISNTIYNDTGYRNILIQSSDPNFSGAKVNVTFINVITGKLDTIGYTLFNLYDGFTDKYTMIDQTTGQRRLITRQDIINDDNSPNCQNIMNRTILFPVCNRINKINYLPRGATISLSPILPQFAYQGNVQSGLFANNVGIGFFTIPNGWNNDLNTIVEDQATMRSILYANDYFNLYDQSNPNSRYVRQNITMHDVQHSYTTYTNMLVTFNDDTQSGDRDFSDVQLQVNIFPSSCIDTTKYFTLNMITKPHYSSFIFDNYGMYYYVAPADYMQIVTHKSVVFVHYITSSTPAANADLYNIFNTLYFNNSATSVDLLGSTTFTITTHINPALIPFESKVYHLFRIDENTTQKYYTNNGDDNDDHLFTAYAQGTGITEHVNIILDGMLYKTLDNNGNNRVDLSYYSVTIDT